MGCTSSTSQVRKLSSWNYTSTRLWPMFPIWHCPWRVHTGFLAAHRVASSSSRSMVVHWRGHLPDRLWSNVATWHLLCSVGSKRISEIWNSATKRMQYPDLFWLIPVDYRISLGMMACNSFLSFISVADSGKRSAQRTWQTVNGPWQKVKICEAHKMPTPSPQTT